MARSATSVIFIYSLLSVVHGAIDKETAQRFQEARSIAERTIYHYFEYIQECSHQHFPSHDFQVDDIQKYLSNPAKTTLGYPRKFTANRRFLANLIGTTQFHHMLEKDEMKMKESFIQKLKYCDTIVMDQKDLQDLYDRHVTDDLSH